MTTAEILKQFPQLRALVVGDICLDHWCTYDPAEAEPSRETSIPRIAVVESECTPGAGGTVANNLAALGAGEVAVLGIIGDDGFGYELRRALQARRIRADLLLQSPEFHTFTYTKLLNRTSGAEDRPRVDFINQRPPSSEFQRRMVERLLDVVPQFDVILVSDQAETEEGGVVTAALRDTLAGIGAACPEKVVWVDSRKRPERFRHAIVKPNEEEAAAACARALGRHDYQALRKLMESPLLLVTHGSRGALLVEPGSETWVATKPVERPVDICGAGDSFSAGGALTYAVTRSAAESARIGNLAAGVTIMKKGTGTASPAEVLEAEARL